MGCACTDKKKLDYDYVRKLANAESLTKKTDIQIYFTFGYDGKTKYYDYEESNGGRRLQVVETIRFSEPKSVSILSNIEQSGLDAVSNKTITLKEVSTGKYKRKTGKSTNTDSGAVL